MLKDPKLICPEDQLEYSLAKISQQISVDQLVKFLWQLAREYRCRRILVVTSCTFFAREYFPADQMQNILHK